MENLPKPTKLGNYGEKGSKAAIKHRVRYVATIYYGKMLYLSDEVEFTLLGA